MGVGSDKCVEMWKGYGDGVWDEGRVNSRGSEIPLA